MLFKPHNGYLLVEEVIPDEEKTNFQWQRENGDLIAVKILSVPFDGNEKFLGRTAVVFSTMVQEFQFRKNKWRVIPENAIIGFIED